MKPKFSCKKNTIIVLISLTVLMYATAPFMHKFPSINLWGWDDHDLLTKMIHDAQKGIFYAGGFFFYGGEDAFNTRTSGLQSFLPLLFNFITFNKLSPGLIYQLVYIFNSFLLACVILMFSNVVKKEFGFIASVSLILSFFSVHMLYLGKSIFGLFWIDLLLPVYMFYSIQREYSHDRFNLNTYFIVPLVVMIIKCLKGYEFCSTFMIATCLPIFYYYFLYNDFNLFIKRFISCSSALILGFLTTVCIHAYLLSCHFNSSIKSGFVYIYGMVSYRSNFSGGEIPNNLADFLAFKSSLEMSYLTEFLLLLTDKEYVFGSSLPIYGSLYTIYVLFIYIFFILFAFFARKSILANYKQKIVALIGVCLLSYTAPLSWFILAKGHSVCHLQYVGILWSLGLVNSFHFILIGICCSAIYNKCVVPSSRDKTSERI